MHVRSIAQVIHVKKDLHIHTYLSLKGKYIHYQVKYPENRGNTGQILAKRPVCSHRGEQSDEYCNEGNWPFLVIKACYWTLIKIVEKCRTHIGLKKKVLRKEVLPLFCLIYL
jgi:hypothetical protein